jgi:hypothetical protein
MRVEPLAFYPDLLRSPLAHSRDRRALALVALLAVSQTANAAGFLWERVAGRAGGRNGRDGKRPRLV